MLMTIIVKQVYWYYVSQISDERLQDHWSSVFLYFQVDNLMNSSEALHNIVESVPGLDADPSVLCEYTLLQK